MKPKQLYRSVKSVTTDDSKATPADILYSRFSTVVEDFPFVKFPDGKPCFAVNSYILDIQTDGVALGTLEAHARNLTPIIRYCHAYNINFSALTDNDIFNLVEQLSSERDNNKPIVLKRKSNTIINILQTTLKFLVWYQQRFLNRASTFLIGEKEDCAQITVKIKVNHNRKNASRNLKKFKNRISILEFDRSGSHYLSHRAIPSSVSVEPRTAITEKQIQEIEKIIDQALSNTLKGIPSNLQAVTSEYLRSRRMFTVFLMKRTGLRPGELIDIEPEQEVLASKSLNIPTLKRRKEQAPIRKFPFKMIDSLRFKRYISSRKAFVSALSEYYPNYIDPKTLLLGERGQAISKSSITKDFVRLSSAAGFEDSNLCFKKFRIRFITQQVASHLKLKMQETGRSRQSFEDADYTTILKRISELTGHKDHESLWFYVELGWEQLGIWTNIDRNIERLNAADNFFDEIMELRHDIAKLNGMANEQVLDFCSQRLSQIMGDCKKLLGDDLENNIL
ncbi:hypothetical protein EBM76_22610 [Vibrio parahaemolyticus]|nr:hypothetical protein [Vibrio parahaemolyticus]